MPRCLTEAEAWRWIAERIEKGEWDQQGLCWEVYELFENIRFEEEITYGTKTQMHARIYHHMAGESFNDVFGGGPWAFAEGDADVRILAAYFLALDAEDYPNG